MPAGNAHRLLNTMYDAFSSIGPGILNDPGSAGTITVSMWGQICPVVTAAAEARTWAQPNRAGIMATCVLDTDGGDLTLTVTGGYNNDDDTVIVFGDAGDFVTFLSIKEGSNYYWRAIAQEGTDAAVEEGVFDSLSVTSLTVAGISVVLDDLPTTAGVGITGTADNFASSVEKVGTLFKTTIVIDVDGLNSGGANDDIIGADGAGVAHLGQITAAVNGAIFAGTLRCIEAPTGGDEDIDLWSAVEATGVEDTLVTDLTETKLCNSGNLVAGSQIPLTAYPAANEYLYLACGTFTDATYTAGILVVELWGK